DADSVRTGERHELEAAYAGGGAGNREREVPDADEQQQSPERDVQVESARERAVHDDIGEPDRERRAERRGDRACAAQRDEPRSDGAADRNRSTEADAEPEEAAGRAGRERADH